MAAVDEFSLFKAIVAGESLETLQAIVKERPQSIRERPERPPGVTRWEWPSHSLSTALHAAIAFCLPDDSVRFIYMSWPQALQEKDSWGNSPWHMLRETHGRAATFHALSLETVYVFAHDFPESLRETNRSEQTALHAAAAASSGYVRSHVLHFIYEQFPEAIRHRCNAGNLPLHEALGMYMPSADTVRFLLGAYRGAVHVRGAGGRLPLHVAAEKSGLASIQIVAEEWPDAIVEPTRDENGGNSGRRRGHNPVHLVVARGGRPDSMLRYLVGLRPAALLQQTDKGYTPLHVAVENAAHIEIIRFLVVQERRALEVWTNSGYLPLHLAAIRGAALPTLTLLADHSPEAVRAECRSGRGGVALHVVAAVGYPPPAAIRLCVRHWPASIRALNRERRAPIHVAVSSAFLCSSRLLCDAIRLLAGPAPELLRLYDRHGHIPLHILLMRKDPPVGVVRCLVEMCPGSILMPTLEEPKQYPLCLAATNPDASLDVLYYLVQQSVAPFFLRQRP